MPDEDEKKARAPVPYDQQDEDIPPSELESEPEELLPEEEPLREGYVRV